MYDFYNRPIPNDDLKRSRKELKRLYEQIPATEGCQENNCKEGGCGGWCCQLQNPQLTFAEFLNTWNHLNHNWKPAEIVDLVIDALRAYLFHDEHKGCLFFDKEKKLCRQHQTRPFNCRMYGQTPEEEFKARMERIKEAYPQLEVREQCKLCKTCGSRPTKDDSDAWFHHLNMVEWQIGVKPTDVHDGDGGSYRTYNDHILLLLANVNFLMEITKLRETQSTLRKQSFLKSMREKLLQNLHLLKING